MLGIFIFLCPNFSSAAEKNLKIVVHNNDSDVQRQDKALGNVRNILNATNENADVVVVSHGGGLSMVIADQTKHRKEVESLLGKGVKFAACENTMAKMGISAEHLLKGVTTVPSAAVEIARKQQEGYSYFKP